MRHIASLFAGLIIGPVAWLLIGAGQIGLNPSLYEAEDGTPTKIIAAAMFAGAGILLGLLAVTRISPVGPVVAGLIMAAGFALFRTEMVAFNLPASLASAKIPASAAVAAGKQGLVLVIACLLVMSALVPSRWRGKDTDDDRDLDTASLSGASSSSTQTTTANSTSAFGSDQPDPIDPFAPQGRTVETGSGFDDRPHDPFGTPAEHSRSPYAGDGYDPDDRGYSSRDEGPTQPQRYGSDRYADQGYGDQRYR